MPALDHLLNASCQKPPLSLAVEAADTSILEFLLESGADVNVRDENGQTPLHVAVDNEYLAEAEILLEHGADPGALGKDYMFPLLLAVLNSDQDMIDCLISHGANPSQLDWTGKSVLASCANRGIFQHLLSLGLDPSERGWTGLSTIDCCLGSYDVALYLLQKGMIQGRHEAIPLNNFRNIGDIGPILAKLLRVLGKGVVRTLVNTEPASPPSPLCYSAIYGYTDLVEILLDMGSDIEFEGHKTGTALMVASAGGELEIVRVLVRRGARIQYYGSGSRDKQETDSGSTLDSGRPVRSAVALCEHHPLVRRWFLVERWTEQEKIEWAAEAPCTWRSQVNSATEDEGGSFRPWSGVRQVQIPLVGHRARQRSESSLEFLCRQYRMRQGWRGEVVHYDILVD